MDGDAVRQTFQPIPPSVSKPLRGDGDALLHYDGAVVLSFLSHYGWMETSCRKTSRAAIPQFLSHYGWMGTSRRDRQLLRILQVSKPLRVDGNPLRDGLPVYHMGVSKPLRVDGDFVMNSEQRIVELGF